MRWIITLTTVFALSLGTGALMGAGVVEIAPASAASVDAEVEATLGPAARAEARPTG